MRLNPNPTELTTAATDAIIALLALGCLLYLWRRRGSEDWKVGIWSGVLGLLGLASALGAAAHGLDLSDSVFAILWQPLFLSLGLVVALFVVAAVYDRFGSAAARRLLPAMVGIGVGFYALTLVFTGTFLVFVLYEGAAMLLALVLYLDLALRTRRAWAWLLVAGIVLNVVAAAIQATGTMSFTLIWQFDHNGVFHLVQMLAIAALVAGVSVSLSGPVQETSGAGAEAVP
jgi:hypothetical protein